MNQSVAVEMDKRHRPSSSQMNLVLFPTFVCFIFLDLFIFNTVFSGMLCNFLKYHLFLSSENVGMRCCGYFQARRPISSSGLYFLCVFPPAGLGWAGVRGAAPCHAAGLGCDYPPVQRPEMAHQSL